MEKTPTDSHKIVTEKTPTDSHKIVMENSLEKLKNTSGDMVKWLETAVNYVEEVLANPEPTAEDIAFGRKLMDIVTTASTQIQPEKLDALVDNAKRDFMMIKYLSTMTNSQVPPPKKSTKSKP